MDKPDKSITRRIMGALGKLMPGDATGENVRAVRMFGRMLRLKELLNGRFIRQWVANERWPVTTGSYIVGDPSATVAACTLTSPELMQPLSEMDGVAIAGRLVTVNLGIEKIIRNIISNPNIRFLVLCGHESPVFHPAQALGCLFQHGIDPDRRINQAQGHFPVLNNITSHHIEHFRQQLTFINCTDELELQALRQQILTLDQKKKPPFLPPTPARQDHGKTSEEKQFKKLRPGGRRGTPTYDPTGFFVINVNHKEEKIILQHYRPDNTPAHEMRGRRAEAILRALVQKGLITQLSHAGYLGVELAKAETALRLGLDYEQDHPIKKS